ncbi:MAG: hypothetical protein AMJ84_10610 [Acidithiobacillales bacterium SM23_46]|nr:MAG: hypothetical protein AMJ84_10610 [Acidithiobacillales bacterium SM23_46]
MKRPVVVVAIVYVAGLCAGPLVRLPPDLTLALVGLIALSQLVLLLRRRAAHDLLLFAAVFLLGDFQHSRIEVQNETARQRAAQLESRGPVRLEGRLASTDRTYDARQTFRLKDCVVRRAGGAAVEFPTAIQLVCSGGAFENARARPPSPGDRVVAFGQFKRPLELSNPDIFNYRAYLEDHGIGASLFVRSRDTVEFSPPDARRSPLELFVAVGEHLRCRIELTLDTALESEAAALVRSVFLGQAQRLDRDVRRDFTRCGLAHIFAVSGLHVGILLWVLDTFVRLFGLRPTWRSVILIVALAVFCAIVGFRAPVVRATVMFSALLAPSFFRYKVMPLTALAAAALVILGANPRALWQASFQLSFVCMLSIILLKPPLDGWLLLDDERASPRRQRCASFLNRHILSLLTVVLSAQVGLVPLLAHYYHRVPALGPLSNLVVAPLVWLIVAMTLVLLGTVALVPAAALVFPGGLNLLSHTVLKLLGIWSTLPAVSILMPSWPVWIAAFYYLLLFGWAVLPREPSPFLAAKQRARLWLALAAIGAWVVWAPAVLRGAGNELHATFLDVGQGDSCVLELPAGAVILVDGGDVSAHAGEFVVVPFLESRGIDHLDAVIATHPDADHIGGLPAVFREHSVAWLVEGPGRGDSEAYERLLEAAAAEPARRDTAFAGDWIEAPMGARLLFLHPRRGAVYSRLNDESLVMMLDWRECEILIAGDIEKAAERDLLASGADLACDVLKVAHHGSASATSRSFLDRAQPRLAVISCGRDNRYGHPRPEVLERLTSAGVAIARTDHDGAVTVRSNGRAFAWRTEGKVKSNDER